MNGVQKAAERFHPSDNPELGPASHEWAHLEIDFRAAIAANLAHRLYTCLSTIVL
jgi:hypothetical protein